ncbi:hypothetical protein EJB05_23126, partial [Eragrostis curvula]
MAMMCIGKHAAAVEAALTTRRRSTTTGGEAPPPPTTMVQMPVEYLEWVLVQKKEHYRVPTLADYEPEDVAKNKETICRVNASLQVAFDEFAEFQAWVAGVVEKNGCISVPSDEVLGETCFQGLVQDKIDDEWEQAREEFHLFQDNMEAVVTGDVPPLGSHVYLLSVYLSLIYRFVSRVID